MVEKDLGDSEGGENARSTTCRLLYGASSDGSEGATNAVELAEDREKSRVRDWPGRYQ